LQESALYCVTDIILFVQLRDEPPVVVTGEKLGGMTSGLTPPKLLRNMLAEPKNYAYKLVDIVMGERKTVFKLGGLTLNNNASRLDNFDCIWDMVLEGEPIVAVHKQKKIERRLKKVGIVSIIMEPEDKL
jgi:hypothetical protein